MQFYGFPGVHTRRTTAEKVLSSVLHKHKTSSVMMIIHISIITRLNLEDSQNSDSADEAVFEEGSDEDENEQKEKVIKGNDL